MANEKEYIPKGTAQDGKLKEGDDLDNSSKDTLGKYLANQTKVNFYPIDESNPRIETSLRGSGNKPADFKTGGEDSNPGFTTFFTDGEGGSTQAVSNFETLSNSQVLSPDIDQILDKNGSGDGHNLLVDITSNRASSEPGIGDTSGATALADPANASPVQKKISAMLTNGNRFDPVPGSSPYIEDGKFTDPGIPIKQGEFGVYNDTAARTAISDLQEIARSLLVRQTGERLGGGDSPDNGDTLTPSAVQRGSDLLDTLKVRALNAYGAPERPSVANAELRYNDVDGKALSSQKSYGALSSYREDFENSPVSNTLTAVGAFGEYLIGALVFTAIFTLVEKLQKQKSPSDPRSPASLKKGQRDLSGSTLKLLEFLGVPTLSNPAWLCAIYGIAAFFRLPSSVLPSPSGDGIPTLPSIPPGGGGGGEKIAAWFTTLTMSGALTDIFSNMLFGSGYYANLTRVVRRDLDVMLSDIGSAASMSSSDPTALFKLLTQLNRYNSWTFYVTLLRMGEVYLKSYQKNIVFDEIPLNGQTKQMLSRGTPSRNELAWRHRSAPALLLLNDKYVNAMTAFGYNQNQAQLLHNKIGDQYSRSPKSPYYDKVGTGRKGQTRGTWGLKSNATSRLSREQVIEVENELDSEYCPFYFHDLRTNEIIGFHAFLSDIKDSYSVSYAESGGYGRIDKVKIYQDTTRSISVSWTLVATSPEDFDSMWFSVNKLVSMIYPQFSMGKPVRAGNKKFIMPFSQIPTATPLIRLRIGDVVRSNYSRFNLARLFGLSEIKPAPPGGGNASDISSAPFDLSATAAIESQTAQKQAEDKKKYEALDLEISERFGSLPASLADDKHGFVPGDPNWGRALLLPSSAGYLTYDTNSGKVIPLGSSTVESMKNIHSSNHPPDGAKKVAADAFISRPSTEGEVVILERVMLPPIGKELPEGGGDVPGSVPLYLVQYKDRDDAADPYSKVSEKTHYHTYMVFTNDLKFIKPEVQASPGEQPDPTITLGKQVTDIHEFFDPNNNAIVRSFEAAGGRGLAGVITSFDMDWGEAVWDMSSIGRRAPTLIKCSIAFSPIHDIIPGLDNNGMMRAMNYPVGNIAGPLGTDFFDPGGIPGDSPGLPADSKLSDASIDNMTNFKKTKKGGGEGGI